jgi:hypothetical protein
MRKADKKAVSNFEIKLLLKDIKTLFELPTSLKYSKLVLHEYPFDLQLLSLSSIYRQSRKMYLQLNGKFSPSICSTMRGLSSQDLFENEIQYTPSLSELTWFRDYGYAVSNASEEIQAFIHFNEISIFHEQNHRIIWRLLAPAPSEQKDMRRYLNFAESLVVTLDLAFADQLGLKNSKAFERVKMIYRPAGQDLYAKKSKSDYRQYLLAIFACTYYLLENIYPKDILKAVNYILPGQKKMNGAAVRRGLQLSEIFTSVTNPQWQNLYWRSGSEKLARIHKNNKEALLYLPEDPLDLKEEFYLVKQILAEFNL